MLNLGNVHTFHNEVAAFVGYPHLTCNRVDSVDPYCFNMPRIDVVYS